MRKPIPIRKLKCHDCGEPHLIKCLPHRNYSEWRCRRCATKLKWSDPQYRLNRAVKKKTKTSDKPHKTTKPRAKLSKAHRLKISEALKGRQLPDAVKLKIAATNKTKFNTMRSVLSEHTKKLWEDPVYRKEVSDKVKQTTSTIAHRHKLADITRTLWADDEYRAKVLTTKSTPEFKKKMALIAASPEYRGKLAAAINRLPRVSSLQTTLYSILDDLGVKYYKERQEGGGDIECVIGPWAFDCVIPRPGQQSLIIECNGDWVHSLPGKAALDKAKAAYIAAYHSNSYILKTLWEHEFADHNRIIETIKYWLGISRISIQEFEFDSVAIKDCPATDYRGLLAKYHYLTNAGRGGIAYGAYLDSSLIAVCIFSPLPRQNIIIQGFGPPETRDLSRLCIHPSYQKKNFGSWFVSRCIKALPIKYRAIVAYADTTFNHTGGIYKACNFAFSRKVKPEYWYVAPDGWAMHKKTLYNKATNLGLTEREYAVRFSYTKVNGFEKLRFVFVR